MCGNAHATANLHGRTGRRLITEACKTHIERAQTAQRMSRQNNMYTVVDIRPLRMVIKPFGHQGDAAHKGKSSVEIGETEFALQRLTPFDPTPLRQLLQQLFNFLDSEP
jgi:hypothetical protein